MNVLWSLSLIEWMREGTLPKIQDDAYFTWKCFHSSLLPDPSAFNCLPSCSLFQHSSREMSSKSDHIIPFLKNPSCGCVSLRIEANVIIQIKNRPIPLVLHELSDRTLLPSPLSLSNSTTLTPWHPESFYFLGGMDRLLFLPECSSSKYQHNSTPHHLSLYDIFSLHFQWLALLMYNLMECTH